MRIRFYGAKATCTIVKVYLFKRGIIYRELKVRIGFYGAKVTCTIVKVCLLKRGIIYRDLKV